MSTIKETRDSSRTPSMVASLFVFGVMVGLILFSVIFFGDEVAVGPLQVSMTLATLVALGVAYRYGHHGALISEAISHHLNSAMGSIFIILAIGTVIASLYLAGTVPAFVYYGVAILKPQYFHITVFILSSLLSILTGSSFTTIGAVGVAFVGLANLMGVNPAIAAGAAVSGAFFGDKIAKISDTFVLTTAVVGGVSGEEHGRYVFRTGIPAWVLSAILFTILGFTRSTTGVTVDPAKVQDVISQSFNISLWAFVPVILIFVLSSMRLSGYITLMLSSIVGVIVAAFTQHDLIISIADNPSLPYLGAVLKAAIEISGHGFHLDSGIQQMDQLFSGGGTFAMFETVWLILIASSFGAIVDYTGMIQRIIEPVIKLAKSASALIAASVLTVFGLNALAADPYVSIVLTAQMYRGAFISKKLKPVALSTAIADGGSIASPIIPWNVHGAFVGGALGVSVLAFAPYAFLCYLQPLVTIVLAYVTLNKETLATEADAETIYGEEPEEDELPAPQLSA